MSFIDETLGANSPFRKGIEGLVGSTSNDGDLIAAHCIDETSTLSNRL